MKRRGVPYLIAGIATALASVSANQVVSSLFDIEALGFLTPLIIVFSMCGGFFANVIGRNRSALFESVLAIIASASLFGVSVLTVAGQGSMGSLDGLGKMSVVFATSLLVVWRQLALAVFLRFILELGIRRFYQTKMMLMERNSQ